MDILNSVRNYIIYAKIATKRYIKSILLNDFRRKSLDF